MASIAGPNIRTICRKFEIAVKNGVNIHFANIANGEVIDYTQFYVLIVFDKEHPIFGDKYYLFDFRTKNNDKYYPEVAPFVKMINPCFLSNIGHAGTVCLDTLSYNWSVLIGIEGVFRAIETLFLTPNTDGGHMNSEASNLWNSCEKEYGELKKSNNDYIDVNNVLKRQAFAPYIKRNDDLYKTHYGLLKQYAKYFPELSNKRLSAADLEFNRQLIDIRKRIAKIPDVENKKDTTTKSEISEDDHLINMIESATFEKRTNVAISGDVAKPKKNPWDKSF